MVRYYHVGNLKFSAGDDVDADTFQATGYDLDDLI